MMEPAIRQMLGRMVTLQRYYDQSVPPEVEQFEAEAPAAPEPARRVSKRAAPPTDEVVVVSSQAPESA